MRNSALLSIALSLALISLSACSGANSNACPPLATYSKADQAKAAGELALLPQPSVLERMITDYGVERKQLLACQK